MPQTLVETAPIAAPRIRSQFWWAFVVYIYSLVLLPAGSVMGVNVKILTFVPLCLVLLNYVLRQANAWLQLSYALLVTAAFLGWTLSSLVFQTTTTELALSQLKDVLTTLVGCWLVRVLTRNELDRRAFIRVVLYAASAGCLLKLAIFLFSLRSGVPVSDIMDRISSVFGVKLMTADLGDLSVRLQFVSDNLLPVCIFALMCQRKKLRIGAKTSLVMMMLLLMSCIYTFSRFVWASAALGILLGWLVSKRDKVHLVYILGVVAAAIPLLPLLIKLFSFRVSGELVAGSDSVRVDQIHALNDFFFDAPFFGHGMGSYTSIVIRSVDVPYAYEVQLLALCGQVGVVGMLLFSTLLVNFYSKAFHSEPGNGLYQLATLAMLADFIAEALFNPCLLTSTAAVTFGLIYALAAEGNCKEDTLENFRVPKRPSMLELLPRI